jgi:hypothetical protein
MHIFLDTIDKLARNLNSYYCLLPKYFLLNVVHTCDFFYQDTCTPICKLLAVILIVNDVMY